MPKTGRKNFKKTEQQKIVKSDITSKTFKNTKVSFYTPDDFTRWRVDTLFTKEPITIEWIDSFRPGEILYDVGANVGTYSVWAAKHKKVNIIAFEPEASNYSLLCQNLILNEIDSSTTFCLALTDSPKISTLHINLKLGGSGNSFEKNVDQNLRTCGKKRIMQGCVGNSIDNIIKEIKPPDHIKIDADGFEHKIIEGAKTLLGSKKVKSLLIEVNTKLKQHTDMVNYLTSIGYSYSQAQVDLALQSRKGGQFEGIAEYVFKLNTDCDFNFNLKTIQPHQIPFPWFFGRNVFPQELYENIINNLPLQEDYIEINKSRSVGGYPLRLTARSDHSYWGTMFKKIMNGKLKAELCRIFGITDDPNSFVEDVLLIKDLPGYAIGPHTDYPNKVITALFYLPKKPIEQAGTSIYMPKNPEFCCSGKRHYGFEDFTKIYTMPFEPNSVFAFMKTNNSFHGVETCNDTRDVLTYQIKKITL